MMKVNGELILTVTTAIEPVTATIHAIVSEDIHDDCLISRADLELLERIPQGFPQRKSAETPTHLPSNKSADNGKDN